MRRSEHDASRHFRGRRFAIERGDELAVSANCGQPPESASRGLISRPKFEATDARPDAGEHSL